MLPDEMWVYEPHHVGFARFGTRWYRIIANYGGGDLVLAPRPAAQDEVDHKFCKAGCKKARFIRKEKWMIRRRDSDELDEPIPAGANGNSGNGVSWKAASVCLGLTLVAGFGIGLATMAIMMMPTASPIVETARRVPSPGSLHQHDRSWWRVEDVLSADQLADTSAAGKHKAYLQAGRAVVTYNFTPPDDGEEKTVYLVLVPSHPPMGLTIPKGNASTPPVASTPPRPPAGVPSSKAPSSPPKGQRG